MLNILFYFLPYQDVYYIRVICTCIWELSPLRNVNSEFWQLRISGCSIINYFNWLTALHISLYSVFFSTFRTELVVYLQEKLPNSTIKRVPASTLYQNMKSVSQQLEAKQVIQCVPKASMSEIQLQNYLKTPPAGLWMLIIFILTSSKLFFHNFSTFYFDLFNRTIYMISLTVGHRFLET